MQWRYLFDCSEHTHSLHSDITVDSGEYLIRLVVPVIGDLFLTPASSDERNPRSDALPLCTPDTRRTPMTGRFTYEFNDASPTAIKSRGNIQDNGPLGSLPCCSACAQQRSSPFLIRYYKLGILKSLTHPIQQMKEAKPPYLPSPDSLPDFESATAPTSIPTRSRCRS